MIEGNLFFSVLDMFYVLQYKIKAFMYSVGVGKTYKNKDLTGGI